MSNSRKRAAHSTAGVVSWFRERLAHPARSRRRFSVITLLLCLLCGVARAEDARSTYLIKLLEGSSQFRVRAQAAISLGAVEKSPAARNALTAALRDVHPAVRAAAATSLGRIGDSGDLPALRKLERDPEEPVRNAARTSISRLDSVRPSSESNAVVEVPEQQKGPALYYVAVGEPASRVTAVDSPTLAEARSFIKARVAQIQGVRLAPDAESVQAAEKVLQRERLKGYYLESSIVSVEKKTGGAMRVAVSVIVATYPGRDMRAMMQGAATVTGSSSQIYRQALEGAFSGALRQVGTAFNR
jgi:hypothetical protein